MKSGTRLNQLEITAPLGAGGMGEVFRARDTRLNRDVAIKVLPKDFAADADRLRRFEQEAKTLAALNHPNIMTVFDAGQHEGAPYLVSELLEGRTLREELAAGALSTRKATDYALQMAQGLAAAHGKGVVHRDLKPDNVFVTRDGRVKILDFGLAKLREVPGPTSPTAGLADPDAPTVEHPAAEPTEPGRVMGTPSYMAPEQVRGEAVDHRADLFAFGCVLYEMVSGRRPFRRDTSIATMAAILDDEPPDLTAARPDLPPAFARIIHRCLEKAPENRFQSTQDLAFALEATRDQSGPAPRSPQHDPAQAWLRWRTVAGFAVLALFAVGVGWWSLHRSKQPAKQAGSAPDATTASVVSNLPPATPSAADLQSIAVLPFVNLSASKDNEYFSDGITEEILNALARTPGLRVAARTSSFSFRGKGESIQRIGDMLKVGVLLEGSVRREGNQLRITAQLINVADGFQLWSDTFDRKAEDVFAIQTEVAQRVQEALKVRLLAGGNPSATLAGTDNLEAYDLYLRGRHFWNQRTGADLERAVGLFQQATEKDPKFAAAYAGLGLSHVLLPRYAAVPVREAIPKARKAARRALELDTRLAEAHTVLGLCTQYDWDLVGAKQEYQAALNLNPNHATSHHWNSWPLRIEGKLGQALAEIRQAQALDPLSAVIQKDAGELLHFSGRYDDALVEVDKALSLSPDFLPAYGARGRIFLAQRRVPEAIAEFEKVWKRTGDTPFALGNLGLAYARAGRTNEARQILEKLKLISEQGANASDEIALVHIGMGELGQAFASLERGAESRDVDPRSWKSEPLLVEVIKDPRYSALLQKFGLDK